ncbi:Reverse transcriptase (RNA-dependent DNA polymerase) [Fragilaria crotonensis]|nr:Reverse transcriptase (RNA-dependent DNA polymerase) [Fragilaria crotonensis]
MPTPVAMSTSEAEYMAACSATMATAHIRMLLYDMLYLGTKQWRETTQRLPSIPAILMIDNEATVQIAKNGKLTRKTRHIERRFHFVRQGQQDGIHQLIGFPVTPNLPISSPRLNTPAKLILTSPRSSVFSPTTCFHHRDQRSDPRGVLEIYCHSVTLSLVITVRLNTIR